MIFGSIQVARQVFPNRCSRTGVLGLGLGLRLTVTLFDNTCSGIPIALLGCGLIFKFPLPTGADIIITFRIDLLKAGLIILQSIIARFCSYGSSIAEWLVHGIIRIIPVITLILESLNFLKFLICQYIIKPLSV